MGFELGLAKNNLLRNGIRTPPPLHDSLDTLRTVNQIGVTFSFSIDVVNQLLAAPLYIVMRSVFMRCDALP